MVLIEKDYPRYMKRCLQLAQLGEYYVAPNPMVGAVLVAEDGRIISEGWHERYGGPHAEVNCFTKAPVDITLCECTLFVSLEPCSHYGKTPPCADLIISKGVKRVVVGCLDPNPQVAGRGIHKIQEAGIEVVTGILEKECRQLNKRFICLQEKKRPYVILKWAQTQDGVMGVRNKVCGIHNEELQEQPRFVISNPLTKQIVHKMRAENMAILVGTNTALLDNPKLLTTHWEGRNPIRVLLDRHQRVPQTAHIFSPDAETIVYSENTDWAFVVHDLGRRGIHSVLVEGGAKVLQHILDSGVYDELHIEVSPQILGTPPAHVQYYYAPKIANLVAPVANIDGNLLFVISHS